MNIYIAHSTNFDFKTELYLPIKQSSLFRIHNVVLPHETSSEQFNSKAFFESDCDLVIAECSYPSTGLGIELGWANDRGIRVIAIHKKENKISGSISLVANLVFEYDQIEIILKKISNVIQVSRHAGTQNSY